MSIPFIDGLNQEVREVACMAGARCVCYTPNRLASLYRTKDALPKESTTHAVYSVKCPTCREEYVVKKNVLEMFVRRNTLLPGTALLCQSS